MTCQPAPDGVCERLDCNNHCPSQEPDIKFHQFACVYPMDKFYVVNGNNEVTETHCTMERAALMAQWCNEHEQRCGRPASYRAIAKPGSVSESHHEPTTETC